MGDGEPTVRPCEVEVVSRKLPFPVRYGLVALRAARDARRLGRRLRDGDLCRCGAAAAAARRPLVAKLVSDPAYERAQRYRLFGGTLEEFQRARSRPVRLLQRLRNAALGRAVTIVVPSAFQGKIAAGWGLDPSRIHVLIEPRAPAARRRRGATAAGDFCLRRAADGREGARHRDRGVCAGAGGAARRRGRRA